MWPAGLALVAASLLVLQTPSYDPTGWLIWGRELVHGELQTLGGPSWKPLPVLFTAPFALAGEDAAPLLWLAVTRLSGLAALAVAYVLGRRLGGPIAGALAAAGVLLESDFLWNTIRGDSEGMLVACALGAVLAHLHGRHRLALVLGVLAGGIRPEVWPLLVLYGVWMVRRWPRDAVLVGGTGLALLAAWFVPDAITTGNWFQSGDRAIIPVEGTPATKAFPFGAVFVEAAPLLVWPFYLGAAYAAWQAWPRRTAEDRVVVALAVVGAALIVLTALLAQFVGFTGNVRYMILPGALLAVAGAVGLPGLVARTPRGLRAAGAVATVAGLTLAVVEIADRFQELSVDRRVLASSLDEAIRLAGGEDAVRACGTIATTPLERQRVAYVLDVAPRFVVDTTIERGTAFVRPRREIRGGIGGLPLHAVTRDWVVRQRC